MKIQIPQSLGLTHNISVRELFDKMLGGKLGRVSVATMLQAAGVSQGLAMELVGHDSAEVHAVYIRPNVEQLRHAVAALPQL